MDRGLVTLAAANQRLAKHHGSAPLRELTPMTVHWRCVKKECVQAKNWPQYNKAADLACVLCGEEAGSKHTMPENQFMKLKDGDFVAKLLSDKGKCKGKGGKGNDSGKGG